MALVLERLGNGAAFLLLDESSGAALLLGCGQLKGAESLHGKRSSADAESDEDGAVPPSGGDDTQYLADLRDLALRQDEGVALQGVLITDCRPETCFMLPFLTEKTGVVQELQSQQQPQQQPVASTLPFPIVMTHATRALGPLVLTDYWSGLFPKGREKAAPYDLQDIQTAFRRSHCIGLKASVSINDLVKVTAYHAGHVAGGCAYFIEIGPTTVLFVNDFNLGGGRVFLPSQIPRLCPTAMITRSAFAVTVSETRASMERELMKVVHECIAAEGKVVIPINRVGFVQEIIAILKDYWGKMKISAPLYITDDLMEFPGPFTPLLRRTFTKTHNELLRPGALIGPGKRASNTELHRFDWKMLEQRRPFVLLVSPANIAQGDSHRAIRALANDAKNLIVLSEHCKPGTINYSLYADPVRQEASKRLGVTVACGVHYFPRHDEVDAKSIMDLVRLVAPQQVLLDHTVSEDVALIKAHLQAQQRQILSLTPEDDSTPRIDTAFVVREVAHSAVTVIDRARDIPLRIHKSMFNNPNDVQGLLIAEPKRKLMLVSSGNGARRLKKKRHTLSFQCMWKKPAEPSRRVKKRAASRPSALSFLLSGPAESADEEEPECVPEPDLAVVDASLEAALKTWIRDVEIEKKGQRWLKLRSVCVHVSTDWSAHLEWNYDDEELAGRVLGITKQVIHAEYNRKLEEEDSTAP
ncbi:hypothetical protein P43SY_007490 [Pythium insidiosum]|uniref:Metallo-beta-lactamase domain-containing protein n=1 Tax=Pythium insidiosum TaxID=114742 RepID=A0AAD5LA49_PYTIN|nr:hypothetical protein P43SY_007490 [Pythium insidiosum]